MPSVREGSFKDCWSFFHFSVYALEDNKIAIQQILVARILNEDQRSIILQTTNFPSPLYVHRNAKFSQNVWKMMLIIYMKNLRFELALNLVFWMVIIPG